MVAEDEMLALVGHRFPGGTCSIEHWENWLLTDCTGRAQLPDDLVHPVALFHVPIQGAGTSIAELFALGMVEGAGSVGLDGYDSLIDMFAQESALKRPNRVEEVAAAAVMLASDAARNMTGCMFPVDGGTMPY